MPDGRRARGDRSRDLALRSGVGLATEHGLDGFSLAELADETGLSKAGIASLFGTKHELQLAIVERAREQLDERVFRPVRAAEPGLDRLTTLGTAWIDHLADPELRGGCFFAAASFELDARPGPLHDLVAADMDRWIRSIARMLADGRDRGELRADLDADDEAFALFAIGITANTMIQLGGAGDPAGRARRVWRRHLDRLLPIQEAGT
ncbi:MAG: TetR family transcriptional regulator C-terminal domain-containing protein [Actinomycetota bacterium]